MEDVQRTNIRVTTDELIAALEQRIKELEDVIKTMQKREREAARLYGETYQRSSNGFRNLF